MKQVAWKEKLIYFWMYYKIVCLAVAIVGMAVGYFAYAKITEKESAFSAILFDIHTNARQEDMEMDFADYAEINTEKYDVLISMDLLFSDSSSENYTMASMSRFYTQVGTEQLDACMMLEKDFMVYARAGCFIDLRDVFSTQELERFPELYTDSEGRVLGVYGNHLPKIDAVNGYSAPGAKSVVGIIYNTKNRETAKKFLEYLLEEE